MDITNAPADKDSFIPTLLIIAVNCDKSYVYSGITGINLPSSFNNSYLS